MARVQHVVLKLCREIRSIPIGKPHRPSLCQTAQQWSREQGSFRLGDGAGDLFALSMNPALLVSAVNGTFPDFRNSGNMEVRPVEIPNHHGVLRKAPQRRV